jgi:hypothetical protein
MKRRVSNRPPAIAAASVLHAQVIRTAQGQSRQETMLFVTEGAAKLKDTLGMSYLLPLARSQCRPPALRSCDRDAGGAHRRGRTGGAGAVRAAARIHAPVSVRDSASADVREGP